MRKHMAQRRWTPEERQLYIDGVGRPRASTIPCAKRKQNRLACRKWK